MADLTDAPDWVAEALALVEQQRYDDALQVYERIITEVPSDASAWSGKARALWNLDRLDDALAAVNRALELAADDASAWRRKGGNSPRSRATG